MTTHESYDGHESCRENGTNLEGTLAEVMAFLDTPFIVHYNRGLL